MQHLIAPTYYIQTSFTKQNETLCRAETRDCLYLPNTLLKIRIKGKVTTTAIRSIAKSQCFTRRMAEEIST